MGEDVSVAHALKHGHTHLDELAPLLKDFSFEHLVLMHFSLRHSKNEIEDATSKLPEDVRSRMRLFLNDDGLAQKW